MSTGFRSLLLTASCAGMLTNCSDPVSTENSAPSLTAVADQQVAFVTGSTYDFAPLSFTLSASDADGDQISYSSPDKPTGATLDPATGVFTWHPAPDQFGTYSVTFRASDGEETVEDTVAITVPVPALPATQNLTILAPNGGETYTYGDSMTVYFLENVDVSIEVVIAFGGAQDPVTVDFNGDELAQHHSFPVDTSGDPNKYYVCLPGQTTVWMGVYKMKIENRTTFAGNVVFQGDMKMRIWDPYSTTCPQCNDGDVTDASFHVDP